MQNILKVPTYEELVEMTNGDLMKRLALALVQLNEAAKEGKNTIEKIKIYKIYETERLKRLELVSKRLKPILINNASKMLPTPDNLP